MKKSGNKRKSNDRRDSELGPPDGWRDRRRGVERRLPLVQEISFQEWVLFRCVTVQKLHTH
jgi:hypothetical protein